MPCNFYEQLLLLSYIKRADSHSPPATQTASYLCEDIMKSCSQDTVGAGFSAKGFPHNHEAVPYDHHLVDLQDFLSKELGDLEVHELAVFFNGLQENAVVSFWEFNSREEIRGNALQ